MSKSLGNLYTLSNLEDKGYDAHDVRYALISGHYRQVLNFKFSVLDAAHSAINKLISLVSTCEDDMQLQFKNYVPCDGLMYFGAAFDALRQDLNIPKCLGKIFFKIKEEKCKNIKFFEELYLMLYILGLNDHVFSAREKNNANENDDKSLLIPDEIIEIAEKRKLAKENKQYKEADDLRVKLREMGWEINDKKDGYSLSSIN